MKAKEKKKETKEEDKWSGALQVGEYQLWRAKPLVERSRSPSSGGGGDDEVITWKSASSRALEQWSCYAVRCGRRPERHHIKKYDYDPDGFALCDEYAICGQPQYYYNGSRKRVRTVGRTPVGFATLEMITVARDSAALQPVSCILTGMDPLDKTDQVVHTPYSHALLLHADQLTDEENLRLDKDYWRDCDREEWPPIVHSFAGIPLLLSNPFSSSNHHHRLRERHAGTQRHCSDNGSPSLPYSDGSRGCDEIDDDDDADDQVQAPVRLTLSMKQQLMPPSSVWSEHCPLAIVLFASSAAASALRQPRSPRRLQPCPII